MFLYVFTGLYDSPGYMISNGFMCFFVMFRLHARGNIRACHWLARSVRKIRATHKQKKTLRSAANSRYLLLVL